MLQCPLCGATVMNTSVAGDFVYGGRADQKFYLCGSCDVAFLHPAMSEDEENVFYAREFEKFMEKRAGKDFDWSGPEAHIRSNQDQYKRRLKFFEGMLVKKPHVLEIGCSSGFMLFPFKEMGMDVVGVEPSGGFTTFLKEKGIPVYDSLGSLKKSKDGSRRFDLVMHFFVLEHVRNPVKFLKEMLELVGKGGCMVFEVPNRSDPLLTIYNIPAFHRFYWSIAHHYYFNRKSLEYVLRQVSDKFEIIPEQRYDLSNHMTWALDGKPGGQGRYLAYFTPELEKVYRESMLKTGYCDTLICKIHK